MALCAHSLSLAEQGKFTYVFASYLAVLLLNVAGIFQGAAVRAPSQNSAAYRTLLARLQWVSASAVSLLLAFFWYALGAWVDWQASFQEAWLLAAFLVLQQAADFDRRSAYIFADARRALWASVALYPLRILLLWYASPTTVVQVLWILLLSTLLPALPSLVIMGRMPLIQGWRQIKAHLHYSRLFILGAPLGWLWSYLPVFLLATFHGKEQAALLVSIRNISNLANMLMEQIETRVGADWARWQHQHGTQSLHQIVRKLMQQGLLLWLCIMLALAIWGQALVALILGDTYAPHWILLPIGWLGYGIYFLVRVFGIKYRTLGANRVEFLGNLSGVLCALLIGYWLIPSAGVLGAAWLYVIIAAAMWGAQFLAIKHTASK